MSGGWDYLGEYGGGAISFGWIGNDRMVSSRNVSWDNIWWGSWIMSGTLYSCMMFCILYMKDDGQEQVTGYGR